MMARNRADLAFIHSMNMAITKLSSKGQLSAVYSEASSFTCREHKQNGDEDQIGVSNMYGLFVIVGTMIVLTAVIYPFRKAAIFRSCGFVSTQEEDATPNAGIAHHGDVDSNQEDAKPHGGKIEDAIEDDVTGVSSKEDVKRGESTRKQVDKKEDVREMAHTTIALAPVNLLSQSDGHDQMAQPVATPNPLELSEGSQRILELSESSVQMAFPGAEENMDAVVKSCESVAAEMQVLMTKMEKLKQELT